MSPDDQTVENIKQDRMYCYAWDIINGKGGGQYIYSLQEGYIYVYENGVWKQLFDIEFLDRVESHIKEITKYPLAMKKQVIENFKHKKYLRLDQFNKHPLLNFNNYMLDIIGLNVLAHKPEYYSTIRIPYNYDAFSKCELWIKTIGEILENDTHKIESLQEYIGYCLTKDTSQIMSLLLLGESKSGKSTILHVLRHLIGLPNCSSVPMKFISNPQYTPLIINKLVNIDADVSEKAEDFEFEFKIITSGEPVNCNQKFVPTFEFIPFCKIVMAANKFPRITDHSSAFYNRLIVIPCTRVFTAQEQDRSLKIKLLEELPGILQWAIEGLRRLNKRGRFEEKQFAKDAIEELREESNPIEAFFREYVLTDVTGPYFLEKGEFYNKYAAWCRDNGNGPLSSIKFGQAVYQKYNKFTPKNAQMHTNGKRIWRNLKYVGSAEVQEVQW